MAYLGELAALTTALCWSITSIFFTLAGRQVGSVLVNRVRLLIATIFLVFTHWLLAIPLPLSAEPERWFWLGLSGIIGLVLGLLFNIFSIPIPALIDDTIGIISRAALPCALFVLGASLSAYKIAGHFTEAWTIVGFKLLLQPFLVWVMAFVVFKIDPLWGAVAVMMAGMPVGINVYMFAQKYQVGLASISGAIVLSTTLAILSQSILLALFI